MIQYWRKTIIFWHTPPLTFQGRAQFGYNSCQKRRQLVIEHGLCFPTRIQLSCLLWDFPTRRWLPSFPTRFVLSSLVWFWHSVVTLHTSSGYSFCRALLTKIAFPFVINFNFAPLTSPSLPVISPTTLPIFQLLLFTLSSCTKTTSPSLTLLRPSSLLWWCSLNLPDISLSTDSKNELTTMRGTWTFLDTPFHSPPHHSWPPLADLTTNVHR